MSKIFVRSLDLSVNQDDLKDHFSSAGKVAKVNLIKDNQGRSKGFAIVEFSNSEEAEKAIKELDGTSLKGRDIKVTEDKSSGGHRRSHSSENSKPMGYFRAQPLDIGVRKKKKSDPFIEDPELLIDYKNEKLLTRFISERGRILPRRMTGLTAANQRHVAKAVKRAQHLAILPYKD